jgi:hypothetical protein
MDILIIADLHTRDTIKAINYRVKAKIVASYKLISMQMPQAI